MHLNNELKTIVFVVLMTTIAIPILSVRAIPSPGPTTYEQYGPRLDTIHMRFLGTSDNVFAELDAGGIDVVDWPLTKIYKDKWENPADPQYANIQVVGSGGEYGYFLLDVREDNTKPLNPPYSTQSYVMTGDPTVKSVIIAGDTYTTTIGALARRALSHMVNRTYVVSDVLGGLADPIYTIIPVAQGGYVYPYAQQYATDKNLAKACLDAAGIVDNDADGWRDIPGTNTEIVLDFYVRAGSGRQEFGTDLTNRIITDLNIHVNAFIGVARTFCSDHVMAAKEGDMYTGGWIFVTLPDNIPWEYSSIGYWHPGNPPNYMRYCGYKDLDNDGQIDFDPRIEAQSTLILESIEGDVVKAAVWEAQRLMQDKENVYTIPVWSASSPKAYRTNKITTAEPWQGIVNEKGFGVNSFWTKLTANTAANPDSGILTYGFSTETLGMLNPIYAQWYWDSEVMGLIYDSMIALDPYTREEIPWVASSWISQLEYDSVQGASVSTLTFNIRNDIYWQDGVQMTADDIIFSQTGLWNTAGTGLLQTGGFPDPWWVSNIANIARIDRIDAFHIKVWMNVATYFALRWVGGNYILPKHIWEDIATSGDPETFAPDPKLVGTGPFRIYPNVYTDVYTPYSSMDLYSYKPGSVSGNPNGYFQYTYVQAEDDPKTLVGTGLESYQRVFVTIYNYKLTALAGVTVTLHANGALIGGPTAVNVPAATDAGRTPGVAKLAFTHTTTFPNTWTYKVTASHGTTTDVDTETFDMKTTVAGDVDETGNGVGNVVNVIDANRLVSNYGSSGPWKYANADITDVGGSANTVDIFDASLLSLNFPQ
jgi:ABC-type transport system substrate-binding protein